MHPTILAYLAAGFTSSEQMLEHAKLRGPSSYLYVMQALAEGDVTRQNSTAMVVVAAEPPGKNVCTMIRKLLGNHTKLIVAAQPGPLAPGNFERLIRASMPDVEKKLRVMDVGDSIADAVSSAESNRHYSKSQALEVFCDQQLARDFAHEVQGGNLNFDPTVIMVTPTEILTDDMGAISKAVTSDDIDAMHRVLDPHIFSDQDSLHTYKSVIKGGQLPSGVEVGGMSEPRPKESLQRESGDIAGAKAKQKMQGMLARIQKIVAHEFSEIDQELEIQDPATRARFIKARVRNVMLTLDSEKLAADSTVVEQLVVEFLTDIASSRELGMAKLDAILKAELGDHFDELEYMGTGRNGSAFRTPDGLIIKITTDPNEAVSAERLQGEQCEYIHHIHEVSQVDEQVWIILQEGGLEKLPQEYCEEFDIAMEIIETIGAGHALRVGDAEDIKEVMIKSGHRDLCMLVAEVMKKFDVGGMLREVKQFGLSADFHSGNIMMRAGRPVLTDLGTHGDAPGSMVESFDGQVVAVFHGSHSYISQLKPVMSQKGLGKGTDLGPGMYFSTSIDDAKKFGPNVYQARVNTDKLMKISATMTPDMDRFRKALHIEDEFLESGEGLWPTIIGLAESLVDVGQYTWPQLMKFIQNKMGYNGIYVPNEVARDAPGNNSAKGDYVIVFDTTQVLDWQAVEDNRLVKQKGPQLGGEQVSELVNSPCSSPGPLQMRGSNSSAWAGGRMVLSNPEPHVPEDENETERDGALDQDIVGGGLDWGRTPRLSH